MSVGAVVGCSCSYICYRNTRWAEDRFVGSCSCADLGCPKSVTCWVPYAWWGGVNGRGKQTGKKWPVRVFCEEFLGEYWGTNPITQCTAAAGETGYSAGYKVRGAPARGWLCRGKKWKFCGHRASHLQHLLGQGGLQVGSASFLLQSQWFSVHRESCVLVTFVLGPGRDAGCDLDEGWGSVVLSQGGSGHSQLWLIDSAFRIGKFGGFQEWCASNHSTLNL